MSRASRASVRSRTVVSADGTRIHCGVVGEGPAVVVVHGSLSTGSSWSSVAELLAHDFEFFLLDRRGRAPSGEGATPHQLAREVEDVRAVVAATGQSAALVGHSYGGTLALETTLVADAGEIGCLCVYEPVLPIAERRARPELVVELRRRMACSFEDGLRFFGENFSSVSPSELAALPSPPSPQDFLGLVPTLPDELEAIHSLAADVERYRSISTPIGLFVGEMSGEVHQATLIRLLEVLPDARVVRLLGQGHIANVTAPTVLGDALGAFLQAPRPATE